MPSHTPPDLIGTAEVCRLLHKHPVTVSRWVESGKLTPAHKLPGKNGAFLFNRADVEALTEDKAAS